MKRLLTLLALLTLLMSGWLPIVGERTVHAAEAKRWTQTEPAINVVHIFHGEMNRRNKPVGFHSRPNGKGPDSARIVKILDGPNQVGVYVAQVAIHNPRSAKWLRKRSSLFPNSMSRKDVIAAILNAYHKGKVDERGKFRGPSGHGFTIEGWTLRDGRINTAYPIYRTGRRR